MPPEIKPPPRPPQGTVPLAAPAAFRPLDDGWVQWIAENKLRGCTVESMIETMRQAGLDPAEARSAIARMDTDPVFMAALKFQQIQRKLESVLDNQQKIWELAPFYDRVEKRSCVTPDEFVTRYVIGCRPVVLTDLAEDWPARTRWSPADLKQRFGHLDVEIQAERSADPRYEENKLALRRTVRLADFVDQVVNGGATNDYYLTANNELLRRPDFAPLLDDIGSLPAFCDPTQLSRHSSFWFGPAGTVTPLHHDTLMLLHTQLVGRKRWRFISPLEIRKVYNHSGVFSPVDIDRPDFDRYPLFRDATVLETIVEPGETVFLPLGWWHQVTALDTSLSFSFSNLALPNTYSYDNPNILNW